MYEPAIDVGRRYVLANQPTGRIILCAVTGSHHYGFASADSDLDLKGIHLAPTGQWLGLEDPVETCDSLRVFEGVECDLTLHEARKALRLLLGGNGNMLERILSPYQLFETPEAAELRALLPGCLSRRFHHHYAGYFRGQMREHEKAAHPQAKTMLYTFRVALTGAHLLRTGELVVDLNRNCRESGFDEVSELVELKRAGGEHAVMPPDLDAALRRRWPDLEQRLADAHRESPLPLEPPGQAALSDWLRSLRRRFED